MNIRSVNIPGRWHLPLATMGLTISLVAPVAQGATLTYSDFGSYLAYDGANLGFAVNLPLEDRWNPAGFGSGLVNYTYAKSFNTTLSGNRETAGNFSAFGQGLFADDGFYFNYGVSAEAECLSNPTAGTCPPSMTSIANLEFQFVPDADATLYLDGSWSGGDGNGLNLVDYFGLSIQKTTGNPFLNQSLLDINTGTSGFTATSGVIDAQFALFAGETYIVSFENATNAAGSAVGVPDFDNGHVTLAASLVDLSDPVNVFEDRFDAELSPVPIPAAAWLFGSAMMIGAGIVGWRKKRPV